MSALPSTSVRGSGPSPASSVDVVSKTAADFAAQLDAAAQRLLALSSQRVVETALALHAEVVRRTPVDTGRARANWFLSEGSPRLETTESTTPEAPPPLTGQSVIYLTNSLPYIVPLEYGHSSQAPQGMLRLAIAKVASDLNAAARP